MDLPRPRQVQSCVVSSYDEMTVSVDKGRAVDTLYPDLIKVLSVVSCSTLMTSEMWTPSWVENWLDHWAQRYFILFVAS